MWENERERERGRGGMGEEERESNRKWWQNREIKQGVILNIYYIVTESKLFTNLNSLTSSLS